MNDNKDSFKYTYSSPTEGERKEIEVIRSKYLKKSDEKLEELRKLDAKVKRNPSIISIALGVIGILVFGLGLSMILKFELFAWGVIICVAGTALMIIAYPIFKYVYNKNMNKFKDRILTLSNELLNEK